MTQNKYTRQRVNEFHFTLCFAHFLVTVKTTLKFKIIICFILLLCHDHESMSEFFYFLILILIRLIKEHFKSFTFVFVCFYFYFRSSVNVRALKRTSFCQLEISCCIYNKNKFLLFLFLFVVLHRLFCGLSVSFFFVHFKAPCTFTQNKALQTLKKKQPKRIISSFNLLILKKG